MRPREAADVSTFDVAAHLDPDVMTREGYGVRGGRPYGEQLTTERRDTAMLNRFRPAAGARLRAATLRALRR